MPSAKRARTAADYLQHLRIPRSKIEAASHGSGRPLQAGDDEQSWDKNRRDDSIVR